MEQADLELLAAVEGHARALCKDHDRAHDVSHLLRVIANARTILDDVSRTSEAAIDSFVVLAACWLHDVIQLPKGAGEPGESACRSARHAGEFLDRLGVSEKRSRHVAAAVRTHSFSGGEKPETFEAGIVQDADRLDALGAIGIARLFAVGAELGSEFYNPGDPLARDRPLEDSRYALDHIPRKLLLLPDLMNTAAGRARARDRAAFLITYRDQLLAEIAAANSWTGDSRE